MGICIFKVDDTLRAIVKHARESKKHGKSFGQKGKAQPGLFFVHDDGVYIMSNGEPPLLNPGKAGNQREASSLVAYARGCDPIKDEATCWEMSRALVGGDDFGETLDGAHFELFEKAIAQGSKEVRIDVRPDTLVITSHG